MAAKTIDELISLCKRRGFIFQSNEKTLTLDEVDVAIKKVVESIISDDEIEVPGYS